MESDTLWYKDAILYEVHVRAFLDGDGDGIGDLKGLVQKLDYLQDLGVTAIWLLPFYPSPLKDDGYDIADYTNIHSDYGNLADFKLLLKEAHARGLRVVTELVMNHTSDQHAWFKRARRKSAGPEDRNFYVWNDNPDKYKEARIIFKDFEASNWAWDRTAGAYFWHRFFSHQPDLNFDNPAVRKAMLQVVDFWLGMGVDGMRLDAVPYLYEREGTNCENLSETHQFLKELRRHTDRKFKNRMILAEANQWPEDAVTYFGDGDECHMAFHFPIMPRLFMALHMEDCYPIIDILRQTPSIPDSAQWAMFLRNHDELTLEMVTDEERDYMYRAYARDQKARINLGIRRRLAPLLRNNRRKMELMNALLFAMPGTPVLYYGDEIGMGDNIYLGDRNGVRTPMQWSADRNAGFSRANPQQLYLPVTIDPEYHYETVNVDAQQNNPHSMLWWMKRLIALRKHYKAFSRGTVEFLCPENRKVLVFIRQCDDEKILVVANLSRFVQYTELDLSAYKGLVPVELFAQNEFPTIGELPYFLTLGPHAFYWFALQTAKQPVEVATGDDDLELLRVSGDWHTVLNDKAKAALQQALPRYLKARRWFGGKARKIKRVEIFETIHLPLEPHEAHLALIRVDYSDGEPDSYLLPLAFATADHCKSLMEHTPHAVIARLRAGKKGDEVDGVLYDALLDRDFAGSLLECIQKRRRFKANHGEARAIPTKALKNALAGTEAGLEVSLMKAEQSNTSVMFGNRLILKMFRRFEEGVNPDLEIGQFLTGTGTFTQTPPVAGFLEYERNRGEPATLAILQGFVPNQGDAWKFTLDALGSYYEKALARQSDTQAKPITGKSLIKLSEQELDPVADELMNPYLESARLLGLRTGQLHCALAQASDDPAFAPEAISPFDQRSRYQSMRNLAQQAFETLGRRLKLLPESIQPKARALFERQEEVMKQFKTIIGLKPTGLRIRIHGDFHLGQVLHTGKDFMIIDFEGEPARSLQDRKLKRSPLRDVAGMLRSFHYAAYTALHQLPDRGMLRKEEIPTIEPLAAFWNGWSSSAFLRAYLQTTRPAGFLPSDENELSVMLRLYTLEKAVYELGYELNNRPDWTWIPVTGITQLLDEGTLA